MDIVILLDFFHPSRCTDHGIALVAGQTCSKLASIQRRAIRVIAVIHRQERCVSSVSDARYIDMDDAERSDAIGKHPVSTLDIILHTPGGLAIAGAEIARRA